jgi:hypothetical protein
MRHFSDIWELHEKIKILCTMKLTAHEIQGMPLLFHTVLQVFAL